jgi:hypothetical protein
MTSIRAERTSPKTLLIALGAYTAMIVAIAFNHVMWRDEVRALSVATGSASWGQLLSELRFEGHPILWYAVLKVGFFITGSRLVLPVLALVFAIAAAFVILRYCPFPMWLRLAAVFGAFLGYELSVKARNYGIGVLLMMVACVAFRDRRDRPLVLGVVLLLLANTSVHAAIAAMVLLFIWLLDVGSAERRSIRTVQGIGAIAIAVGGILFSLLSSRPGPGMAWATGLESLSVNKIPAMIFADPGRSLRDIAAVSQFPWHIVGIKGNLAASIIVDLCIVWLLWCLRRNPRALVAVVITVVGYAIFFLNVYSGSLRHAGMVLFLIIAICWIEYDRAPSPRIVLGLLPLLLLQLLALPVMAGRALLHPESSSKSLASFIRERPQYRNAVLMAEPDYFMEAMPYYVGNPIFMPRNGEFRNRVSFDKTGLRRRILSLDELTTMAQRVSCERRQPVLLSIGHRDFRTMQEGAGYPAYEGMKFTWDAASRARLGRPVADFPYATSDETYLVYEVTGCAPSSAKPM